MKTLKIAYWVSTCLFCGVFLMTGTLYIVHAQTMVTKFNEIGFPLYILNLIGPLKIAGALTLLIPAAPPRLKEWAYAGFTFAWICAFVAHYLAGDGSKAFMPLILLVILFVSYFTEPARHLRQTGT